ncbi:MULTISPECIES: hypothetical protein [Bacillaceae]
MRYIFQKGSDTSKTLLLLHGIGRTEQDLLIVDKEYFHQWDPPSSSTDG